MNHFHHLHAEVLLVTEAMLVLSVAALGCTETYATLVAARISCSFFAGTTSVLKTYVTAAPKQLRTPSAYR